MSREDVELIKRIIARGDAEFLADYGEAIEWHTRVDEPDAGIHRGIVAVRRYVESWLAAFPDLRVDADEFIDAGNWVVAVTRLVGSGGASGAGVDDTYVFAGRVVDGKLIEMREYATKAEAFEAVELQSRTTRPG